MKVIGGVPDGEFKAIASGALPNGKPVVVNSDGTVSVVGGSAVSGSTGTPQTFYSAEATRTCVVYDSANDKIVVAYRDGPNGDVSKAVVGTISGTSVTFGTPVQFSSDNCFQDFKMAYDSANGKIVVVWGSSTSPYPVYAIVGTVSGTSISFGSQATAFAGYASGGGSSIPRVVYDSANDKVVVLYRDESASGQGKGVVGTVSGTSISFGSAATFNSSNTYDIDAAFDSGNGKVFVAFRDIGNSNYGTGVVGTVSGTSITFGTKVVYESAEATENTTCYDSANAKVAVFYQDAGNGQYGTYAIGTISGTSVTFGTPAVIASARREKMNCAYNAVTGKITISWKNGTVGDSGYLNNGTISGTTMTFDTAYQIETGAFNYNFTTAAGSVTVTSYTDAGNSNYGKVVVDQQAYTSTNLTAENYIGMSRGVVTGAAGGAGAATVFESASTTWSAAVFDSSNNKVVIAYTDGGNSSYGTAVVGTVSGTSISFGTPVVFESASSQYFSLAFDTTSNKVVIGYKDVGNSNQGTAIVGTVSGTSISFGTPTIFETGNTFYISTVYDSNAGKIVIAYSDAGNSFYGKAIVGTVSGTSISFGSEVTFESASTEYVAAAYDETAQKVVITYRDGGNSNYGTAVVGTVSGTSISYGTPAVFNTANSKIESLVYDSTNNKVVVFFRDATDQGSAAVGTVSGTSISFGSVVVFDSSASYYIRTVFDDAVGKISVFYVDFGNSYYGSFIEGTVSGTSISFDGAGVFNTARSDYIGAAYDSNSNKTVVAYKDSGNSDYGTAVVFTPDTINRYPVADGNPARVDIIGSVSDNQLSLTAGEKYYVQTDGTITTTAGDPSVLAGTAISATKLVVKT